MVVKEFCSITHRSAWAPHKTQGVVNARIKTEYKVSLGVVQREKESCEGHGVGKESDGL